jgi:hypothetical protein
MPHEDVIPSFILTPARRNVFNDGGRDLSIVPL